MQNKDFKEFLRTGIKEQREERFTKLDEDIRSYTRGVDRPDDGEGLEAARGGGLAGYAYDKVRQMFRPLTKLGYNPEEVLTAWSKVHQAYIQNCGTGIDPEVFYRIALALRKTENKQPEQVADFLISKLPESCETQKKVQDPDTDPDPDDQTGAIPILKYSQEKGPVEDPTTGEIKMKRLEPLRAKLAKSGLPQNVINTIIRSIVAQLECNEVPITEREDPDLPSIDLPSPEKDEGGSPGIKKVAKYLKIQKRGYEDLKMWKIEREVYGTDALAAARDAFESLKRYHKVKDFPKEPIEEAPNSPAKLRKAIKKNIARKDWSGATTNFISGIINTLNKGWSQVKQAEGRVKRGEQDKVEAAASITNSADAFIKFYDLGIELITKYKDRNNDEEQPKKKSLPHDWITLGGTQEEWDALDKKEKLVFFRMDKKQKKKFFKMDKNSKKTVTQQRHDLYDKLNPKSSPLDRLDPGRKEKVAQAAQAAREQGFNWKKDCESYKGTIKVSTLNQQLQMIGDAGDPDNLPIDKETRRKAMNLVLKHLQPHLKKHKIKLAEHQIKQFSTKLMQEMQRRRNIGLTEMKVHNHSDRDISEIVEKLESFIPHAQKYIGYEEHPELNFVSDAENAQNILGKTAFYDPQAQAVTIYVDNRHPKDIMRSISHELVHHKQNGEGQFDRDDLDVGEGYAQRDDHLKEMEREAYETGNMCFREWEDLYKMNNALQEKNKELYEMLLRRLT